MVVKAKEKFEKTRHVKNNNKSEIYFLRGEKKTMYHERNLSNKMKSYKLSWMTFLLSLIT